MDAIGIIFGIAWYAVGLWGLIIARQKGHMQWFGGLGIVAFLLYGWVIALIVLFIPLMLGPIMWAIAKYVLTDRRTPATWVPSVRPE